MIKKVRLLALVLALFLAILATTSYAASATNQPQPSGGSHFVRIPTAAQADLAQLRLTPAISLDYGSFLWLELNGADLAALTASGISFTAVPDAGQIQIVTHRFDPLADGEPAVAPAMQADASQPGFHLIQFNGPVRDEWLQVLEATGLPMLQYYPHNAYLTWGSATALANVEGLPFVRWQGPVHPAYKIDPGLAQMNGRIHNVDIMFYNDGDIDGTLSAIRTLGAHILQAFPSQPDKAFYDAIVQMDAADLTAVAQLNTVLWMGHLSPEPILDDEMSSQIVAGNHPGGTPVPGYYAHLAALGVDGTGVTWAVVDTGVDYDHPDLGPNIVGGYSFPGACNPPGQPGSDCSGGGHGTHVAGIVGGTGAAGFTDPGGFLYGLGVAPGYGIFAMNSLSAGAWPPAGGWQEHSKQAVLGGAIGGNNSWTTGEGTNHGYQASERTHDIMVRDGNFDTASVAEPFIEVFSAGNSGPSPSTLTAPKEAKNLIIVASSRNFRVGSIDTISSFSSRGPAVDGRWVPTISTPGEQIASARNDLGGSCSTPIGGTNNLYAFCSGTSMAAPHTSGAVVLFTEWWRDFNSGNDPSPAMAKALLVNGSVDMGTADIPNIHEGWGRVNITNIISPSVPFVFQDQTDLFTDTGQQIVLSLGVADPTEPLKITLTWSDAPGAVGANPALVNNLNLTVVNDGNTYLGNVFSGGWSTTGGTVDNINNLENVYIQNPGGALTIIIDAANIAGDGVPYNGDTTDQDFALVCQNCALNSDFTISATPTNQDICTPANAVYTINVGSILGFNDPVNLSATGNPAGTTTNFSVNPVTPPGNSTLTIGNTGAAAAGSYNISVVGMAPTSTHTTTVGLTVYTGVPGAPTLLTPTDGETDVPLVPTFTWSAASQGSTYDLDVATDNGFGNIVYSATGIADLQHTMTTALDSTTTYYWRVSASNACGSGSASAAFSFTTRAVPPILLVDDDDNSPDVRATYTSALDNLGAQYDIWDTNNSDDEPTLTELLPYQTVIWFTGDEFGGAAGPGGAGETALAGWLDGSGCLFISSQDYHYDRGLTPFMADYLGASTISDDDGNYTSVTGQGSVFSGLGPYPLVYPFSDFSDPITANASAELAFQGNNSNGAAVNKDGGVYRTTFWVFPWEALSTAGARETTMQTVLDWCGDLVFYGVNLSPTSQSQPADPGEVVTYTVNIQNTGTVSDTYNISVAGNVWSSTPSVSSIWLEAGDSDSFTVAVSVPGGAVPGDADTATVTAVSQNDAAASDNVSLTTYVPLLDVAMGTSTPAQAGDPGVMLAYTVMVSNTGNVADTYDLSLSGQSWNSSLSASSVALNAGQSTAVTVWVDVPGDALAGDSDTVTVTAVSQANAAVSAALDLTSTANAVYGVLSSSADPDQSGLPGSSVTYTVWVTNTGNSADDVDLSTAGHAWATDLSTTSLSLAVGQSDSVVVTVTIPADAAGGATDTAVVTATSQGDPGQSDSVSLTTTATAVAGVTLSADPAALTAEPGTVVSYTVHITNTGNTTDTFSLSTADDNGWTSHVEPVTITLGAGESDMVLVLVHVPGDAVNDEMNVTTLTAVSDNDATATAEVALTTTATVVPPDGDYFIFLPIILKP